MHYIFILVSILTDSVNFFDSDTVQITCQPAANHKSSNFRILNCVREGGSAVPHILNFGSGCR